MKSILYKRIRNVKTATLIVVSLTAFLQLIIMFGVILPYPKMKAMETKIELLESKQSRQSQRIQEILQQLQN